ncbi:CBS domain-containing protein [Streptomyces sp. NPDC056524]|uniref:CBS domain-containing protein n=1 Tax=Streptomyces sp. NPDC056524 TaxID=3345851 RepID=UPI0036B71D8D
MTPVQMQPRPTHPAPTQPTAADGVNTSAGPSVCDDMTVEVALAVMAGAHTGHLFLCDNDDEYTGLVTRAQLTTVRESPGYTDRLRLRDLSGDSGPFDSGPFTPAFTSTPTRAPRPRGVVTPSVVGEQDGTPGTPAPALVLA